MNVYLKELVYFQKFKNKIKHNIIVFGSGRWAKVIISELLENFPNIKHIIIVTNYKNQLEKWKKKKNFKKIIITSNYKELKKYNSNFALVVNKNEDHYKTCSKAINLNQNVLVEKPLRINELSLKKLINESIKKKLFIYLSLPYLFANYFLYIKKKIIKKKKIKKINIEWLDKKNEIRYGFLKRHDDNIHYLEDIFYHLFSLISIFLGSKKITVKQKLQKFNDIFIAKFKFQNTEIEIKFSKKSKIRKRILKIGFSNKKDITVNFSNDKKVLIISERKIDLPKDISQKTLKYQLFNFLSSNFSNSINNRANLRNLKYLFLSLKEIRKII